MDGEPLQTLKAQVLNISELMVSDPVRREQDFNVSLLGRSPSSSSQLREFIAPSSDLTQCEISFQRTEPTCRFIASYLVCFNWSGAEQRSSNWDWTGRHDQFIPKSDCNTAAYWEHSEETWSEISPYTFTSTSTWSVYLSPVTEWMLGDGRALFASKPQSTLVSSNRHRSLTVTKWLLL